ncbi:MAG: metallophosphoesterase [Oscillospiraceae bacterium]|nr:metallophosphoesterase [Oscillospiraceae bacterium]
MKILILSDSHGEQCYMEQAVLQEKPDCIIHLGDHSRDADTLGQTFPSIPMLSVAGNCDFASMAEETLVTDVRGVRFFITHGHRHGVKTNLLRLGYAAQEHLAQIVLYGHTHVADSRQLGDIHFLNPGACSGAKPSYAVVEIPQQVEFTCRIEYFL